MKKAVLYLRSSKDRSDVSIDSQRRELHKLAATNQITIIDEYIDAVESAKNENRPSFQLMVSALKSKDRNWNTILMTDTSRLSRRRYAAQIFKHECNKKGVEIIFSKFPEVDPIAKVLLESVFEAMDEVHSLMSKEKGLAGMAENINQGFRAGGSAPKGYKLKAIPTGAIRDGVAVTKSKLEKSNDASLVSAYLKKRANNTPRAKALKDLNIKWPTSTMVDVEWNALTYAGHTVWNVRNETIEGKYKGGVKRKPRKDWMITENTHPSLITEQEAETILNKLENSTISQSVSAARRGLSNYLLTGVLVSPDGRKWEGQQQKAYRLKANKELNLKGRQLQSTLVDQAITDKLICDMKSQQFIAQLLKEANKNSIKEDPTIDLRKKLSQLDRDISKAMDVVLKLANPDPALRKIEELEKTRESTINEITRLEAEHASHHSLKNLTADQMHFIIDGLAEDLQGKEKSKLKELIASFVDKITLYQLTLECCIHYHIAVDNSLVWRPQGGSNPRYRRERAVS